MLLSISLVGIVVLNNAHILLNIYFQQVEVTIGMAIVLSVIVGSIVSFIFIDTKTKMILTLKSNIPHKKGPLFLSL